MINLINIISLTQDACCSNDYLNSYMKLFAFWNNTIDSVSQEDFENGYKYLIACANITIELNQMLSDAEKMVRKNFLTDELNREKQVEYSNLEYVDSINLKKKRDYPTLWHKLQNDTRFVLLATFLKLLFNKKNKL